MSRSTAAQPRRKSDGLVGLTGPRTWPTRTPPDGSKGVVITAVLQRVSRGSATNVGQLTNKGESNIRQHLRRCLVCWFAEWGFRRLRLALVSWCSLGCGCSQVTTGFRPDGWTSATAKAERLQPRSIWPWRGSLGCGTFYWFDTPCFPLKYSTLLRFVPEVRGRARGVA